MNDKEFDLAMKQIVYITRHNNAREIIGTLGVEMIRQYMVTKGVK